MVIKVSLKRLRAISRHFNPLETAERRNSCDIYSDFILPLRDNKLVGGAIKLFS